MELGAKGPNLFGSASPKLPVSNAKVSGKIKGLQGNIAQVFGGAPEPVSIKTDVVAPIPAKRAEVKSPIHILPQPTSPVKVAPINQLETEVAQVQSSMVSGSTTIQNQATTSINPFAVRGFSNSDKVASPVKSSPLRNDADLFNPFDFEAAQPRSPEVNGAVFDDVFGDAAASLMTTGKLL